VQKSVNFLEMIGQGKVAEVLVGTWIVMGLLLIFGFFANRSLARASDAILPDTGISIRSMSEMLVEWLDSFTHDVLEQHGYRALVPFFGSLFLFILAANLFGLIPGMEPPTADTDVTFGLGLVCFVYFMAQGIRRQGVIGLLRNEIVGPIWWLFFLMIPINVADLLFRPFSLGIRLYANMFADHTVLGIFTGLTKVIVPLAFYALGSIVCIIQALIFVVLSMSYVRLASGHGEH
jgi:F-type H+-transporting ATPase subunit a